MLGLAVRAVTQGIKTIVEIQFSGFSFLAMLLYFQSGLSFPNLSLDPVRRVKPPALLHLATSRQAPHTNRHARTLYRTTGGEAD